MDKEYFDSLTDEQKWHLYNGTQKDPEVEEPKQEDLYGIGTVAEIKQLVKLPKNIVRVLVEGLSRAELIRFTETEPYLNAVGGSVVIDCLEREEITRIFSDAVDAIMQGDVPTLNLEGNISAGIIFRKSKFICLI